MLNRKWLVANRVKSQTTQSHLLGTMLLRRETSELPGGDETGRIVLARGSKCHFW